MERSQLIGGSSPAILVVDDEPAIRFALCRYFTRRGWRVGEAANGGEALNSVLGGAEWDVVLCDVGLPVMTGIELHERLSLVAPRLAERVVLTSGDVSTAELAAFRRRTECAVVAKPFALASLAAVVAEVAAGGVGAALAA